MLARGSSNNPTHARTPREVDLLHTRMRHELLGDLRPIRGLVGDQVEAARRKASLAEDISNRPGALRSCLGAFEDCCVACGEWEGDGSQAEVVGSVPGRPM